MLIPIDLPPGFYRNGTELESAGRWRAGNLVRWRDNTMQPVGGWVRRQDAGGSKLSAITSNPPRGAIGWQDNSGGRWIAVASHDALKVMTSSGTITSITPGSLTSGRTDAAVNVGFGGGFFGKGLFGTPRPDTGTLSEATTWSLDTWGEYLVGCTPDDGTLWEWQLNTGANAAAITNAPTDCSALFVTPERFLVALRAGGEPLKVQWSDKEDNTTWTAAATNEAGDFTLQSGVSIMSGVNVRGQSLVLTEVDAYSMTYVGPPFVYGFERVGTSCGISSRRALVAAHDGAFWMGNRAFFAYSGGAVQELQSDVADYVFTDINQSQVSKVYAVANSSFGEVWWFYPSGGSLECDRYVAFNYRENYWLIGEMDRTCGFDRGVFRYPVWLTSGGLIYNQETGTDHEADTPYAESGPFSLGQNTMHVVEMWPDEKTQGDVTATFKTRQYSNDTEREYGPYTMSAPTSVRFAGREVKLRITEASNNDWRVGLPRLIVRDGGGR